MANPEKSRAFVRKTVRFLVQVTSLTTGRKGAVDPAPYKFVAFDISPGGIGLETNLQLEAGDTVELAFSLKGELRAIRVAGEVKHVEQPNPDKRIYKAGVKFTKIEPADRAHLVNFVVQAGMLF